VWYVRIFIHHDFVQKWRTYSEQPYTCTGWLRIWSQISFDWNSEFVIGDVWIIQVSDLFSRDSTSGVITVLLPQGCIVSNIMMANKGRSIVEQSMKTLLFTSSCHLPFLVLSLCINCESRFKCFLQFCAVIVFFSWMTSHSVRSHHQTAGNSTFQAHEQTPLQVQLVAVSQIWPLLGWKRSSVLGTVFGD
jgi:hypothetical protein